MHEDRFPSTHADRPGPAAGSRGGFDLIPCGVVTGARALGNENRMAQGQHGLYRLILRLEAFCHALACRVSAGRMPRWTTPTRRLRRSTH